MLTVIKKKGNEEPFDQNKLIVSILNAARDAEIPMSHKEAELAASDVKKQLEALRGPQGVTSSFEVRAMVRAALRGMGFGKVSQMFERGRLFDPDDIERHRQAIRDHEKALEELTGAQGAASDETDPDENKTALYKSSGLW